MDTCPPFDAFLKPMLVLANMGEINVRESADKIADDFGMTDKAKLETKKVVTSAATLTERIGRQLIYVKQDCLPPLDRYRRKIATSSPPTPHQGNV